MRIIQSVGPDLNVCLTNDNKLVIMIDNEDGEVLAEITDMDRLFQAVRHVDLVRAENPSDRPPMITTAEVELNRRQAQ